MAELHSAPSSLIRYLVDTMGFVRRRPLEHVSGFEIVYLDLTRLKLDLGFFVPFFISKAHFTKAAISNEEIRTVARDVSELKVGAGVRIVVLGGDVGAVAPEVVDELSTLGIAILDHRTIIEIYNAEDQRAKQKTLVSAIARFVGRQALSPYTSGLPATGGRFFGRKQLVAQLVGGRIRGNFTIVGGRRIGKTSLLQEVKSRLVTNVPSLRMSEVYGGIRNSTQDVLQGILEGLGASNQLSRLSGDALLGRFFPIIRQLRPLVVFIDEMDRLLEFDSQQNFELFHILRQVFAEDGCRIFMAGFRRTIQAFQNADSPLYNFSQRIDLGPLSWAETREMVEAPLDLLGLDITHTPVAKLIFEVTGGQPSLIQFCCCEVIDQIAESGQLPSAADLKPTLYASQQFQEMVARSFLSNVNNMERLLALLLFREQRTKGEPIHFDMKQTDDLLRLHGIAANLSMLYDIVGRLALIGIVHHDRHNRYSLQAPFLPEFIFKGVDLDLLLDEALSSLDLKAGNPLRPLADSREEATESEADLPLSVSEDQRHTLFLSYNKSDTDWATWIAWVMEEVGHTVIFQAWDFTVGTNFVHKMHEGLDRADKIVLVLSNNYLASGFAESEWSAIFRSDPTGSERKLIPIRVRKCSPTGLLGSIVYLDLVGRSEAEARQEVILALKQRLKPESRPEFPFEFDQATKVQENKPRVPYPGT